MDAIVNQRCPSCSGSISVRADEVKVTAHDESDSELTTGLCRISAVWSCPDCDWIDGHTWYADADELVYGEFVPWVGESNGAETCIDVGPHADTEGERVRSGEEV